MREKTRIAVGALLLPLVNVACGVSTWGRGAESSQTVAPEGSSTAGLPAGGSSRGSDSSGLSAQEPSSVREINASGAGAVFLRNGLPFCFAGANNNYLTHKPPKVVNDVFVQAKAMGLKVVRTWAFVDRGSLDNRVPSVDGDGTKEGVFFRYWDTAKQRVAYNDGVDGLQQLDAMLVMASDQGLQVSLVLTNNWSDFGGMDQYASWFNLDSHHKFYTDNRARRAYRDYAEHLVERVNSITGVTYRDDPTIFSWELANDPRCTNGGALDQPEQCDPEVLTTWAAEMSAFIHSIDPNHLVAVGDGGFFREKNASHWLRNGTLGVDHRALVALPTIDYATFQLYPEHWGMPLNFGEKWVEEHVAAARKVGKPTMLTEYGLAIASASAPRSLQKRLDERAIRYSEWNQAVLSGGGSAALFWRLVGSDSANSETGYAKDFDGMSVYNREEDSVAPLIRGVAEEFGQKAQACQEFEWVSQQTKAGFLANASPFVSVAKIEKNAALASSEVGRLSVPQGAVTESSGNSPAGKNLDQEKGRK